MSPDRWEIVKTVFESALGLDGTQRAALLERTDPDVRDEVERLLTNDANASGFLEQPIIESSTILGMDLAEPCVFEIGERLLNRFEIQEFLGRGGMGEVYRSFDSTLGETVALKTVRFSYAQDDVMSERFKLEVQHARKVTHVNVCRIYDLFVSPTRFHFDVPFLTMEYLAGYTLYAQIRDQGPLPAAKALPVAEQICAGLAAAHESGVLHRDLKSANVILVSSAQQSLRCVITDFGLAKSLHGATSAATLSAGGVPGTIAYLAPELLEGKTAGTSSDIYALGVVLYEMVTGRFPFEAEAELVSAAMRLKTPPAPPRTYSPGLPANWETAILWCLSLAPDRRPRRPQLVSSLLQSRLSGKLAAAVSAFSAGLLNRRTFIVGGSLGAGAAATAAFLHFRAKPNGLPRVLVEEINAPGNESWGRVVRDLMRVALRQSPILRLLDDPEIESTANRIGKSANPVSGGVANAIAKAARAGFTISGRLTQDSGSYQLQITLIDVESGRNVASAFETLPLKSIAAGIDRICLRFRRALGEAPEEIGRRSRPLAQPDTASAESAEHFARALDLYYQGDIQSALGLLETATRLDPDFAMAYVYQAIMNAALRRNEEAFPAAVQAFKLRERANDRGRYEAESIYYSMCGDYDKSLDRKRVLAALFPSEAQLHRSVAHAYSLVQRFDDAIRHGRIAVQLDQTNASNRMLLAGILSQANQPDVALREIHDFRGRNGSEPILYSGEGFALLMKDDIEGALQAFEHLGQSKDLEDLAKAYRAIALLVSGRLAEASEQLEAEIEIAMARQDHSYEDLRRYWLGQVRVLEGNTVAAGQQAQLLAMRAPRPPNIFALRSAAELADAVSDARTLRMTVGKLDQIHSEYPSTRSEAILEQARGLLAAKYGDSAKARGHLGRAHAVWPDLPNTWSLAGHLRAASAFGEAGALYEKILAAKGTALRFEGVVLWICSIAMSARCYAVLGDCKNSLTRLNQFLARWGTNIRLGLVKETSVECAGCQKG